jgi:hypothetical protein
MTHCQGGLQSLNLSQQVMELDQVVHQAKEQVFSSLYWNDCA